jgi:hypothetical protein
MNCLSARHSDRQLLAVQYMIGHRIAECAMRRPAVMNSVSRIGFDNRTDIQKATAPLFGYRFIACAREADF